MPRTSSVRAIISSLDMIAGMASLTNELVILDVQLIIFTEAGTPNAFDSALIDINSLKMREPRNTAVLPSRHAGAN